MVVSAVVELRKGALVVELAKAVELVIVLDEFRNRPFVLVVISMDDELVLFANKTLLVEFRRAAVVELAYFVLLMLLVTGDAVVEALPTTVADPSPVLRSTVLVLETALLPDVIPDVLDVVFQRPDVVALWYGTVMVVLCHSVLVLLTAVYEVDVTISVVNGAGAVIVTGVTPRQEQAEE